MFRKKNFIQLLIGVVTILLPTLIMGQAHAHRVQGYIITTQGDTLRGSIHIPRFATAEGITLFADNQASSHKYSTLDLRLIILQDGRRFIKRTIQTNHNSETGRIDSSAVILQHLVGGAANFYRYDSKIPTQGTTPSETVHYFIDVAGSGPVRMRRTTYQATLATVFKDCPAVVENISRIRFTEYELSNLILQYNSLCQNNPSASDYRLPQEPSSLHSFVSLRGGLQSGQLMHPSSDYFTGADPQYSTLPSYSLELRLANKNAWSLVSGVNYSKMRTEVTTTKQAQLGTINAGQLLALPASMEVTSLQFPVLLRYTLGHSVLRPYLSAGPMIGIFTNNRTTLSYTTLTYLGGNANEYRNDVVTLAAKTQEKINYTFSGTARLGLQLKTKSRISPLIEVQYSRGRNTDQYFGVQQSAAGLETLGNLRYDSLGFMAGLEF